MFSTIFKKEMLDHILSMRLASLLILCMLLVPFSMYVSYRKYLVKHSAYVELRNAYRADERMEYSAGTHPDYFRIFRPPSPLSVLVNGLEDSLPVYMRVDKTGIRLGPSAMSEKSIVALFGDIDFLFLMKIIFSLLAILLAFDLVAGEKELGTLRAMLAHSLPRSSVIAAKYLAGYVTLVIPFLLSVGVGLSALYFGGFPLFSKDLFLRVLLMGLGSLLYVSVFFSLGLLISSSFHRSKTALLVLLLLWVFLVFILPKAGYIAAEILRPVQSEQTIYAKKRLLGDDIEGEKNARMQSLWKRIVGDADPFKDEIGEQFSVYKKERKPLFEEYEQRFVQEMKRIDDEHRRKKLRQEQLGMVLSRISPSSCFSYVMSNLANTGELEKQSYFSATERYREDMNREVFSKTRTDKVKRGTYIYRFGEKDEDFPEPEEYPRPSLRTPSLSESLKSSLLDILLLVLFNILCTISSHVSFLRYDVR